MNERPVIAVDYEIRAKHFLREAEQALSLAAREQASRELSLATTNLQQAIMWLEQDIRVRLPRAHP